MPEESLENQIQHILQEAVKKITDTIRLEGDKKLKVVTDTHAEQLKVLEKRVEQAEKRAEQSERRAKYSVDTLETIPHPAIRVDSDHRIDRMNKLAAQRFGYTLGEVERRPLFDFVAPGELEILRLVTAYDSLLESIVAEDVEELPVTITTKDGKKLLLNAQVKLLASYTPGYQGAVLSFIPRSLHLINRMMPTNTQVIVAKMYAEEGALHDYSKKVEDKSFGKLVIAPFISGHKGRKKLTIIDMEGVTSCSSEVYDFLTKAQLMHRSDPHFDIKIYTDSETIRNELLQHGFPETNIQKERKKKK